MNTSTAHLSILLAGLLAVAGVHAQSAPPVGSSDLPPKAGEASTMVQGRPNAMLDQHNAARSRADVVNELLQRRGMYEAARRDAQAMGYTGAVGPQ